MNHRFIFSIIRPFILCGLFAGVFGCGDSDSGGDEAMLPQTRELPPRLMEPPLSCCNPSDPEPSPS